VDLFSTSAKLLIQQSDFNSEPPSYKHRHVYLQLKVALMKKHLGASINLF